VNVPVAVQAARLHAKRKRSTKRRHSEARGERLAALVVGAAFGARLAQSRRAPPGLLLEVAAELGDVIAGALS
jgi:hypothetical protein